MRASRPRYLLGLSLDFLDRSQELILSDRCPYGIWGLRGTVGQLRVRAARLEVRSMLSLRRRLSGIRRLTHHKTQKIGFAEASSDRFDRHLFKFVWTMIVKKRYEQNNAMWTALIGQVRKGSSSYIIYQAMYIIGSDIEKQSWPSKIGAPSGDADRALSIWKKQMQVESNSVRRCCEAEIYQ